MCAGEVARWRLSKRLLPLINQAAAGYYASRDGELETWRHGELERWRGGDMERTEGRTKNNGANSDEPMLIFLSVYSMSMAEIVTKQGNIAQAWK